MITSTRNPRIQELRALQRRAKRRREAGAFVVEGVRLAEEALAANWPLRTAFYTEELSERGRELIASLQSGDADVQLISPEVLAAASDTETPQGILLELAEHDLTIPEEVSLVLILDALRDPGNLGTLLRSAAAAGADAVLLGPGCVDAYNPKVLRSAMGAHFRLPLRAWGWQEIKDFCGQHSLAVYLAAMDEGTAMYDADLAAPSALLIGGEAKGAGVEAQELAAGNLHIPMRGETESLNAAIAGSLLLFEALRQRRTKPA